MLVILTDMSSYADALREVRLSAHVAACLARSRVVGVWDDVIDGATNVF